MPEKNDADIAEIIPISSKWRETLLYLLIFAWLAYMFVETLTWTNPQDWWGPMGAILLGFVLVTLKIIHIHTEKLWTKVLKKGRKRTEAQTRAREDDGEEINDEIEELTQSMEDARSSEEDAPLPVQDRRAIVLMGWIVLYPVTLFLVGFYVATPPYLFALLYYLTRDAKRTIRTAMIVLVFLYVLFVEILAVQFYSGSVDLPFLFVFF